jgi:hypothetical protein
MTRTLQEYRLKLLTMRRYKESTVREMQATRQLVTRNSCNTDLMISCLILLLTTNFRLADAINGNVSIRQHHLRGQIRRLSSKYSKSNKHVENEFESSCISTLGPMYENKTLSQTKYANFLINYCTSKTEYKGPACTNHKGVRVFNTLDFDFQLAFLSKSCTDEDPVRQLECIQSLVYSGTDFYYQGDDIQDLCKTSFSLLQTSKMLDIIEENSYEHNYGKGA